jgi:hypothetical protein
MDALERIVAKLGGSEDLQRCIASLGNSHSDESVLAELLHLEQFTTP